MELLRPWPSRQKKTKLINSGFWIDPVLVNVPVQLATQDFLNSLFIKMVPRACIL